MLNDFEKINIRPFNDHSMLGETLELNKKAADWFKEAQKRMESCQKWHDIVQKDMQPLFDRNRKIVLEKMKKEAEQNNKTKE